MSHPQNQNTLLESVMTIAREAGALIMEIYQSDFGMRSKEDASPVTQADEQAEQLILTCLRALEPQTPIVSEEAAANGHIPKTNKRFWLVDPLDGTKEFIQRNGEFTVNIALIEDGHPILGVVYAPALDRMYAGAQGSGAWMEFNGQRQPVTCRDIPTDGLDVVASRSHGDNQALDQFLQGRLVRSIKSAGSSLKICLVAAGEADIYPRLGRTMEWDIAAGHAVLAAAGGQIRTLDGDVLRYGKSDLSNPHFYACSQQYA
ncbi:3'(2'),5'-bisphosphate nucleotidase CysQ [Comamonas sp. NoAH]|uniref:3'(2'),5'-bisphosphate nucleotidase CysQ n=1 Tax=Comamonas halotolerans TaxID=3041496 RepID=UPI0024E0B716|nr:3'(2'),5'-bisphosphate nucleotidase CysQ [Comamonas sp. NoAH]